MYRMHIIIIHFSISIRPLISFRTMTNLFKSSLTNDRSRLDMHEYDLIINYRYSTVIVLNDWHHLTFLMRCNFNVDPIIFKAEIIAKATEKIYSNTILTE